MRVLLIASLASIASLIPCIPPARGVTYRHAKETEIAGPGRPDIDEFEAAMTRAGRQKGFFVAFDYTEDALEEVGRWFRSDHRVIVCLTVKEILEERIAQELA